MSEGGRLIDKGEERERERRTEREMRNAERYQTSLTDVEKSLCGNSHGHTLTQQSMHSGEPVI